MAAGARGHDPLSLGGSWLHLTSHWSEWFDEELAFGDAPPILAKPGGAVVFAPLFEEVVFRGLLFATLRRALGPRLAIAVSGGVFAWPTATGRWVSGRALSGMLWAWAFEKTGSVLPGMVAHAVTNLMVTVTVLDPVALTAGPSTPRIIRAVNDLERELRKVIAGGVRFDPFSKLLYSTDASMYQMEPVGVVIPRDAADVQAAAGSGAAADVAVLSRGGGTSLTGQTVNRALVLDFSAHMNRVLEVNAEELWARVQPGLVQDELNHHVRSQGLLFGPDTSTSNRATLGGMMGNNSGGSHSITYGLTVEHVIEVVALLADGSRVVFTEIPGRIRGQVRAATAGRGRSTARWRVCATRTRRRSRAATRCTGGAWPATT